MDLLKHRIIVFSVCFSDLMKLSLWKPDFLLRNSILFPKQIPCQISQNQQFISIEKNLVFRAAK
jgi:hypothetical protein